MNSENRTVDPLEHGAHWIASGRWFFCVSFNGMPDALDGDRLDLSEELVTDGPLDAPDRIAGGGCYSDMCPFSAEPYTGMIAVSREEAFA